MGDASAASPSIPPTLPVIDICPFLSLSSSDPEARKATASAINDACTNYGFFYLTGHGIPTSKLNEIISLAREFFSLPLQEKNKIKRYEAGGSEGRDGARGYQGVGENITQGKRDLHEAVDWYREWNGDDKDDTVPEDTSNKEESGKKRNGPPYQTLHGPNLWPTQPAELKSVYLDYIARLKKVGETVVRAMGAALHLEDEEIFVRNTDKSFWVMRMIGYPPLPPDIDEVSCGTHTDYGCVTLLLADPTPGALQVLSKDSNGGEEETWINADPMPGAYVVNIGDMLELWTGGKWKSTRHRVVHRGRGYRVSVPFFFEPNFGSVVKPLLEARVGEGGEKREVVYGEHLLGKIGGNFYTGSSVI